MPGIGWECRGCHQFLDEDKYFQWKPTCICEAKGAHDWSAHSQACYQKDSKDKHNKLYPFIKEHVKKCSALKSSRPNYSLCPNCFMASDNPFTCPNCNKKVGKVDDDNDNPQQRERERDKIGILNLSNAPNVEDFFPEASVTPKDARTIITANSPKTSAKSVKETILSLRMVFVLNAI